VSEAQEIEQLDELAEEVRITRLTPAPGTLSARRSQSRMPVRSAAAAAAGGLVAGAVLRIVSRRHRRSTALMEKRRPLLRARRTRFARRRKATPEPLQILASQRLLVDVHLLGRPGSDR